MVARAAFAIALVLVACGGRGTSASTTPRAIASSPFRAREAPIYESRIFVVGKPLHAKAQALLGERALALVTQDVAAALLPDASLDPEEMLDAQEEAADAYAELQESKAADPFFASARSSLVEEAKAHRELARYTDELAPEALQPYLVKAEAYFEGTGALSVALKGDQLMVHGSPGEATPPVTQPLFVVVFVERKIEHVVVSAGVAQ
jgi:hypothetical protein